MSCSGSAFAAFPNAVGVLSATGVSNLFFKVPAVVDVPAVACVPAISGVPIVANIPSVNDVSYQSVPAIGLA
jgi:hypothetical protein